MRVLVISDTHKNHENLKVVLRREFRRVDLVIHLGMRKGMKTILGSCRLSIRNCGWK